MKILGNRGGEELVKLPTHELIFCYRELKRTEHNIASHKVVNLRSVYRLSSVQIGGDNAVSQ